MYIPDLQNWLKLAHGKQFFTVFSKNLERLNHDLIPPQSGLPWVVGDSRHHMKTLSNPTPYWLSGNGPLDRYVGPLKSKIPSADDFCRSVENEYSLKLQPRNIFLRHLFDDKIRAMDNTPVASCHLDHEYILSVMSHEGLGRTAGNVYPLSQMKPPPGSTSLGGVYDSLIGRVITGAKNDYWVSILAQARMAWEFVENLPISWNNIDSWAGYIIKFLDIMYVPSVRLDRGVKKVRLIWAGNAVMYALEQMVSVGIKRDMHEVRNLGYTPTAGAVFRDAVGDMKVLTGDFSACDTHFSCESMKAAWRAWQILYRLPEKLMMLLYVANTFGPVALWNDRDELCLVDRRGINPSGSGAFVIIMNLIVRSLICKAVCTLDGISLEATSWQQRGVSFGDDHAVPFPWVRMEWVRAMAKYGQVVRDVTVYKSCFKFLRALYGPEYTRVPITFSRFRNAVCPEDSGILSRSAQLCAIGLRAQLLPFMVMAQTSAGWRACYDELYRILVGEKDRLLIDLNDSELSYLVGTEANRELDALFFAKRQYQVRDSREFIP